MGPGGLSSDYTCRMRMTMTAFALALFLSGCATAPAGSAASVASPDSSDSIATKVTGMERIDGFIPMYWNEADGKLYLELSRFDEEVLYQTSLPAGLGSNPIGLDRNQLGDTYLVRFQRVGPRVLMIQPNYGFRAISDDPLERTAVEESFAQSVQWGFDVVASSPDRVLVDATSFFLRDTHGVARALDRAGQGTFTLEPSRSVFWLPRTKGFPKNSEVETMLTFTSARPGPMVRSVAPDPSSVTIRQHHSFVELPGPGYVPREHDPRVGYIFVSFHDYASPIHEPIRKRWILRHRLQKKDPSAAVSEPIEPIVYYLDPGTPEPIRSALLEGARWWNEAYEAAGFRNAYRVEMLPPGADPMDVRYNLISWVHRSTRGWSYGSSVVDPRTGEIIKGNVSLGSLRVRQDILLAEGLIPLFDEPTAVAAGEYLASLDPSTSPTTMALARLRQLSAHEVGHTIGLSHNFAASTYGRESVMDYPAPLVNIRGDRLDLSDAYDAGIGEYDKFAIRWGYSEFAPGTDEQAELARIVREGIAAGMLYLSDEDARPAGAAHPLANLWDNGPDPITGLRHAIEVRRIALQNIGLGSLAEGRPVSLLEATFLPLYLHHRYQVDAAAKMLGGVYYTYSVRTGGVPLPATLNETVPAQQQKAALELLLSTLDPSFLTVPRRLLDLLPPAAEGTVAETVETFVSRTGLTFDPVGVASISADMTITNLLQPERAERLIQQQALDPAQPGFHGVIRALVEQTWGARSRDGYEQAIRSTTRSMVVRRLMDTATDRNASPQVRAIAEEELRRLHARLTRESGGSALEVAVRRSAVADIQRFLERPADTWVPTAPLPAPAGSPI